MENYLENILKNYSCQDPTVTKRACKQDFSNWFRSVAKIVNSMMNKAYRWESPGRLPAWKPSIHPAWHCRICPAVLSSCRKYYQIHQIILTLSKTTERKSMITPALVVTIVVFFLLLSLVGLFLNFTSRKSDLTYPGKDSAAYVKVVPSINAERHTGKNTL